VAKKKVANKTSEVNVDRRKLDQRTAVDRRKNQIPVAVELRQRERRKVNRRRQIDPTTCERDYSEEEIEFMHALDEYKRKNGRMFPTCSEILEVVRKLGYERRTESVLDIVVSPQSTPDPTDEDSSQVTSELENNDPVESV